MREDCEHPGWRSLDVELGRGLDFAYAECKSCGIISRRSPQLVRRRGESNAINPVVFLPPNVKPILEGRWGMPEIADFLASREEDVRRRLVPEMKALFRSCFPESLDSILGFFWYRDAGAVPLRTALEVLENILDDFEKETAQMPPELTSRIYGPLLRVDPIIDIVQGKEPIPPGTDEAREKLRATGIRVLRALTDEKFEAVIPEGLQRRIDEIVKEEV